MASVESITGKIDGGEGALGEFINDDEIYTKVEEAVDTTSNLIKSLNQVKTWVRAEDEYFDSLEVNTMSLALRIEPRPSRYFLIGATFIQPVGDQATVTTDDELVLYPDVLIAERIFDNRLALKIGMIEGKVGGGFDWTIFDNRLEDSPLSVNKLELIFEARDKYDAGDIDYNEHVDTFIARTKLEYKFARYFFVSVGADNMLGDDPGYSVSIGFEYIDQDITTVVGLMNMK
jgi:phospholipid/cholesterol/gamma-HCH transport system substrate-binding protein